MGVALRFPPCVDALFSQLVLFTFADEYVCALLWSRLQTTSKISPPVLGFEGASMFDQISFGFVGVGDICNPFCQDRMLTQLFSKLVYMHF